MAPNPPNDKREAYLQLIESQLMINDRFENIQRIDPNGGDGNFSLVFTAYERNARQEVILKFFDPGFFGDLDRLARFRREGEILLKLKGKPNILQCIDGICEVRIDLTSSSGIPIPMVFPFIPLEKAKKGSIEQFIYSGTGTPERNLIYFREMCKSVARIHRLNVFHRDLRPGNFLIFTDSEVKLGDFGAAKFLDGSMPDIRLNYSRPVGHLYYSPELFCQLGIADEYTFSADIFSMGAILFEMFSKEVLLNHLYNQDFQGAIMKLNSILLVSPEKYRVDYYLSAIDGITQVATFPEISSFNDFVPNCIKRHLDSLYKALTQINMKKRLVNFQDIFRKIDICLLTLRNEDKYRKWLQRKKEMRLSVSQNIVMGEKDA